MKGYYSITIPTKSYIKAYLHTLYGEHAIVERKDNIGKHFYSLLERGTNPKKTEYSSIRYNTTIKLHVSYWTFRKVGCNLNETNVMEFNGFVEDEIKRFFYILMNTYTAILPSFEANLPIVRKQLGIDEDDWSTDSMKKDYYRYRKQKKMPSFYKKSFGRYVPSEKAEHQPF